MAMIHPEFVQRMRPVQTIGPFNLSEDERDLKSYIGEQMGYAMLDYPPERVAAILISCGADILAHKAGTSDIQLEKLLTEARDLLNTYGRETLGVLIAMGFR